MKKIIATILTLILATTCLFSATIVTSAADTAIPEGLVVAFDFEGDDAATQLADKANAGNVKDDLTISGLVVIDNGEAFVAPTKGAELKFMGSDDLRSLTGYTIYVKLKATGEYGANWTNPIMSNGLFRMIINGKADGAFTLQGRANASHATQHPIPEALSFKEGEWFYAAYTASIEDGKLKVATYYSMDGVAYVQATAEHNVTYANMNVTNFTVLGGKQDGSIEMTFDEVMFFNRALSADEVKTLSSIELTAPAVDTEPADTTPADTTPVETQPVETQPVDTTPVETTPVETTPVETTPVDTADTQAPDASESIDDTDVTEKKGCGGTVGMGTAVLAIFSLGVAACAKKKED